MACMKGAVVVNGSLGGGKYLEPAHMVVSAGRSMGHGMCIMDNTDIIAPIGGDRPGIVSDLDFIVFWDKDVELAAQLESYGIPVFNQSECIRVCDDKALTHMVMASKDIPMPETVRIPFTFRNIGYRDVSFVDGVADLLGYPFVLKDCFGSFGRQVRLIPDRESFLRELKGSCEPLVAQRYIECGSRDRRLEVIGGRVVEAVERIGADGDFRSNATLGGTMVPCTPTDEEEELALRACEAVGADFAGVDIITSADGPLVCEVNSNAHITNLLNCTGHDVSIDIMEHITGVLS